MRGWRVSAALVAAAACAPKAAPPPAKPVAPAPHVAGVVVDDRPLIAVIALDAPADARPLARAITDELRATMAAKYEVSSNRDELHDLQDLASCPDREAASCIADIGSFLDANYVLYGHLERRGAKYVLALDLLDVDARFTRRAVTIDVDDPRTTARIAFEKLGMVP